MNKQSANFSSRRSARLAAVQALYQLEQTDSKIDTVLNEFIAFRFSTPQEDDIYFKTDLPFFRELANGVIDNLSHLDQIIQDDLAENWRIERLPSVMRAILRSACYELSQQELVPTPVIINEYIEIAKDFFQEREAAFVNGILDSIAKKIRESAH